MTEKKEPVMVRYAELTPLAEEIIEKHLKWAFGPKKDQPSEGSTNDV